MTFRTRIEKLEQAASVPKARGGSAKQRLVDMLDRIKSNGSPRLQICKSDINAEKSLDLLDTRSPAEKLSAFLDGQTQLTESKHEP